MDIMAHFLQTELQNQVAYTEMLQFVASLYIRSGEYEGEEYVIRKLDHLNFIIAREYVGLDGEREISRPVVIDRQALVAKINKHVRARGIALINVCV
ncbi:hypothetical protein HCA55_05455 [Listeria booriae]|uniref:Uncharacterized protein n=1 Tax=Listeria booriae TaxID=1552123 RepID=A0A7X0XXK1_9LIST|nr:hypothetical protein [Listeria booriae]MBC1793623.1 hypothetical protein [Listeria booriae]MBC1796162.1 hypothetical protein [Listeria booriae]MBC1800415.1 hypothetical protein [Listeria booriae]MBC1802973.1 hypothetical protein [Listeria booriae]MBC1812985.1 hypothetical protein [Listeria booriae]